MRRNRQRSQAPISLFSFQDIMMSVMGILLLITLLLALDLTFAIATDPPASTDVPEPDTDRAEREALRRQVDAVREHFEAMLADVNRLVGASGDRGREMAELRAMLEQTIAEVGALEARVRKEGEMLPEWRRRQARGRARLEQIARLREEAARLRSRVEAESLNPRLTYIVQRDESKTAILLDISTDAFGIGSPDPSQSVLWLSAPDVSERLRQLAAWAGSHDPATAYFVILARPATFDDLYGRVRLTLRRLGFDVGTEPIPDRAIVLVGREAER